MRTNDRPSATPLPRVESLEARQLASASPLLHNYSVSAFMLNLEMATSRPTYVSTHRPVGGGTHKPSGGTGKPTSHKPTGSTQKPGGSTHSTGGTTTGGGTTTAVAGAGSGANTSGSGTTPTTSTVTPGRTNYALLYAFPPGWPTNPDYTGVNADVNTPVSDDVFKALPAGALKIAHGRFQHFSAADDGGDAYFPWAQFLQYNAQLVAQGHPSMLVSANYQGQDRPVYFSWLYQNNNIKAQAVNVADPDYINFWINDYALPIVQRLGVNNVYIGIDNMATFYSLYGVLDNSGTFVPNVTWDSAYAQNDQQLLNSYEYFFQQVKTQAPQIKLMPNFGGIYDESQFGPLFQNVDGMMYESLVQTPNDFNFHVAWQTRFNELTWLGDNNKAVVLEGDMPVSNDPAFQKTLITQYAGFMLVQNSNFYFAPENGSTPTPPQDFEPIAAKLGSPLGAAMETPGGVASGGLDLYSRTYQGGTVYLNMTGHTLTIPLPSGQRYVDAGGNVITQLVLSDGSGGFALNG